MPRFIPEALLRQLEPIAGSSGFCVAYSGGRDSHTLLHALSRIRDRLGGPLRAAHVNHQLQPDSACWARHCQAVCAELAIPLSVHAVDARATPGESPQAAARDARYDALREALAPDEVLLTAHHQDDQAETLLLQLLRGAGPHGLAGMPESQRFGVGHLARPLLGFTRTALEQYALETGLVWVEDPSNQESSYDRNFLRQAVLPPLLGRWPGLVGTLARAARHQADASELLDELAAADLRSIAGAADTLSVSALIALSPARQRNLLRHWIRSCHLPVPDSRQLEAIRREVLDARPDATPRVAWPGGEVRRYRGALHAMQAVPPAPSRAAHAWIDLSNPLLIPGVGRLQLEPAPTGLDPVALARAPVSIRFRRGGERCRSAGRGGSRPLKDLLQEWGVPPWLRGRIPLLYVGDELAAVVGHCLCEPFVAPAGAQSLMPRLLPL